MFKRNAKWVVTLLFALGVLFNGFQLPAMAAGENANISVEGNQATGTILPSTTVSLNPNDTAFDVLVNTVGEKNVDYSTESYGKMIKGINGLEATGTNYWSFYINGISAQVGADQYKVQPGDQISFRYLDWSKAPENTVSLKITDDKQNVMNNLSNIEFVGNPTAFQLLETAIGASKVVYSDSSYGKYITSINGLSSTGNSYWAFYVNGKMSNVGVDSYQLKPGDQISFQYETWKAPVSTPSTGTDQPSGTYSAEQLQKAINANIQYVNKSQLDEWEIIALSKAGAKIPTAYLGNVQKQIKEKNDHFVKITDTERYIMGILAAGGDPTNIEGYNLVQSVYNGNVTKQGLNGVAYALIALDSGGFSIPNSSLWTKEKLTNYLIKKQNNDGGWTWDGSTTSDPDTTAMVLTALAPFKNQQGVKEKVDSAVKFLSAEFLNSKIDNSSTAAQMVIALSSLGIDANSSQFTDGKNSLITYLMSFQDENQRDINYGGFKWKNGEQVDSFSTEQGFQALVAYQLFQSKKGVLYQFAFHTVQASAVKTSNVAQNGNTLPNTGTNAMNLVLIGCLLFMIGIALFVIRRVKRVN